MMSMDEFYQRLEAEFLPEDMEDLSELWESIHSQIEVMRGRGMPEDEILRNIGSPQEIAADYYADKNLEAAAHAEKSVVPSEDVARVYKFKQRLRRQMFYRRVRGLLKALGIALLFAAGAFMLVYLLYELIAERHLAAFPLATLLAAGLALLLIFRGRRSAKPRRVALPVLLVLAVYAGVTALLLLTGSFYYGGVELFRQFEIPGTALQNLHVTSDVPIDVSLLHGSDEDYHVILNGSATRRISLQAEDFAVRDGVGSLSLTEWAVFGLFTSSPYLELVIYTPRDVFPREVDIAVSDGAITVANQELGSARLESRHGTIRFSNVSGEEAELRSATADIIVDRAAFPSLRIRTGDGQVIVRECAELGELGAYSRSNLVLLQDSRLAAADIETRSGKIVVEDTVIPQLRLQSVAGEIILTRQSGHSRIVNDRGQILIKYVEGGIETRNGSGGTVVNQKGSVSGTLESAGGLIRWVQPDNRDALFQIRKESGGYENQFEAVSSPAFTVQITTQTGNVKVIKAS